MPKAFFPCQVLDISAGGILINCAEPFAEGDRLVIADAPLVANAPTFNFSCQIRRAGEWKKGVSRYGCFRPSSPSSGRKFASARPAERAGTNRQTPVSRRWGTGVLSFSTKLDQPKGLFHTFSFFLTGNLPISTQNQKKNL